MTSLEAAEEQLFNVLAKSYGKDLEKDPDLKDLLRVVYAAGKVSGSVKHNQ